MVAAGEALNPEVLRAWHEATGLRDPRRLRPDRDRPADRGTARRASRGPARWAGRCRVWASRSQNGELIADPASVPTFFLGYLGEAGRCERDAARARRRAGRSQISDRRAGGPWRTGDRVREDGRLALVRGAQRRRDRLGRLPHRALRGRVRAGGPPRGGRGGGRGGTRRGARSGRARGGRAARGPPPLARAGE